MDQSKRLTASQEDYLEAIYHISEEKQAARAKDIARYLKVKASSVTGALRVLGARGLVNYAPYDIITLTEKGSVAAKDIVHRHRSLKRFLVNVLGVDDEEAEEAACRMEHAVPRSIVERMIKYSEYVDKCPRGGASWASGFGYYCGHGCSEEGCRQCDGNHADRT